VLGAWLISRHIPINAPDQQIDSTRQSCQPATCLRTDCGVGMREPGGGRLIARTTGANPWPQLLALAPSCSSQLPTTTCMPRSAELPPGAFETHGLRDRDEGGQRAEAVHRAPDPRDGGAVRCGGISPAWRHKASQAVAGKAKVSSVTFGVESVPAATAFDAAFRAGKVQREAFIFIEADSDPARDRFTRTGPGQNTTFVAVPDDETGPRLQPDSPAMALR
jgi:hypothetical protein